MLKCAEFLGAKWFQIGLYNNHPYHLDLKLFLKLYLPRPKDERVETDILAVIWETEEAQ